MPGRSFTLIAHRGSPLRAPENTLASFLLAEAEGARAIETDIQLTADGVPVLCHDDTLRRYGHGDRTVASLTLAEIRQLDFGSWHDAAFQGEPILTLEALLTRFGCRFAYHLELKDRHPDTAQATLALLEKFQLSATITSFHFAQLERLHACAPDQSAGWLVHSITPEVIAEATRLGLQQICPKADAITPEAIAVAGAFQLRAWGCPREAEAARAVVARLRETPCVGITVDELRWFRHFC